MSGEVFGFVLPVVGRAAVAASRTRDVGAMTGVVGSGRRRAATTTDLKMVSEVLMWCLRRSTCVFTMRIIVFAIFKRNNSWMRPVRYVKELSNADGRIFVVSCL